MSSSIEPTYPNDMVFIRYNSREQRHASSGLLRSRGAMFTPPGAGSRYHFQSASFFALLIQRRIDCACDQESSRGTSRFPRGTTDTPLSSGEDRSICPSRLAENVRARRIDAGNRHRQYHGNRFAERTKCVSARKLEPRTRATPSLARRRSH